MTTNDSWGWSAHSPVAFSPSGARERSTGRVIASVAVVMAVVAAALAVVAEPASSWYPRHWDPRIAPIADEVQTLRGLDFLHPVRVTFLPDREFEKRIAADNGPDGPASNPELERESAIFRAFGWIGPNVDLRKAVDASDQSSVLAFYSNRTKEIVVRGTSLDVSHRATIAHELTHVLQDQHFDLTRLQQRAADSKTGDESAFTALVEGDAVTIHDKYLQSLSASDRSAYDAQQRTEGDRVEAQTSGVPDIVTVLSSAPYVLGPASVALLEQQDGIAGIDDALTGPTPSTRLFLEPGDTETTPDMVDPVAPPQDTTIGSTEPFGPFELALALAPRVDALRAIEAGDAVEPGRAVTYRDAGRVCYRVEMNPRFAGSRSFVDGTLGAWARGAPWITVNTDAPTIAFTACDPGNRARQTPDSRLDAVMQLLEFRAGFAIGIGKSAGVTPAQARCVARVVVQDPGIAPMLVALGDRTPNAQETSVVRAAAVDAVSQCRAGIDAGYLGT